MLRKRGAPFKAKSTHKTKCRTQASTIVTRISGDGGAGVVWKLFVT